MNTYLSVQQFSQASKARARKKEEREGKEKGQGRQKRVPERPTRTSTWKQSANQTSEESSGPRHELRMPWERPAAPYACASTGTASVAEASALLFQPVLIVPRKKVRTPRLIRIERPSIAVVLPADEELQDRFTPRANLITGPTTGPMSPRLKIPRIVGSRKMDLMRAAKDPSLKTVNLVDEFRGRL